MGASEHPVISADAGPVAVAALCAVAAVRSASAAAVDGRMRSKMVAAAVFAAVQSPEVALTHRTAGGVAPSACRRKPDVRLALFNSSLD